MIPLEKYSMLYKIPLLKGDKFMKTILQLTLGISSVTSNIVFYLGGTIIHLWTVYIVYVYHGIFAAGVSFAIPILSELYVLYQFTISLGFVNVYSLTIIFFFIIVIATVVLNILVINLLQKLE